MRHLIWLSVFVVSAEVAAQEGGHASGAASQFGALGQAYGTFEILSSCEDLAKNYPLDESAKGRVEKLQKLDQELKALAGTRDPYLVKDYMARRFINSSDWDAYLSKHPGAPLDPADVYEPKPETWNFWRNATEKVEAHSRERKSVRVADLLEWNQSVVKVTSTAKTGVFKETANWGCNGTRDEALDDAEIENLRRMGLQWHELACAEDLPDPIPLKAETSPECAAIIKNAAKHGAVNADWKQTAQDVKKGYLTKQELLKGKRWYWFACWPRAKAPAGVKKCGAIQYLDPKEARKKIFLLAKEVMLFHRCRRLGVGIDPVAYAVSAQVRMVALHPFNRGNGRASRWVMDGIALREKLPFLITPDMNRDLSTPFATHFQRVNDFTVDRLNFVKDCLSHAPDEKLPPACELLPSLKK